MNRIIEKLYDDFQENNFMVLDKNNDNSYKNCIGSIYMLCNNIEKQINEITDKNETEILMDELINMIHLSIRLNGLYTFQYAFKTGIEIK